MTGASHYNSRSICRKPFKCIKESISMRKYLDNTKRYTNMIKISIQCVEHYWLNKGNTRSTSCKRTTTKSLFFIKRCSLIFESTLNCYYTIHRHMFVVVVDSRIISR
uniref:Uncharacterized protein n=1 Tax=Romanomermis culicivorax TaxID=13658 RepID=A0A915IDL2_ROMCU